jgi:hypothetical protein
LHNFTIIFGKYTQLSLLAHARATEARLASTQTRLSPFVSTGCGGRGKEEVSHRKSLLVVFENHFSSSSSSSSSPLPSLHPSLLQEDLFRGCSLLFPNVSAETILHPNGRGSLDCCCCCFDGSDSKNVSSSSYQEKSPSLRSLEEKKI